MEINVPNISKEAINQANNNKYDHDSVNNILNELDTSPIVTPRHMTLVLRDIAYELKEIKDLIMELVLEKKNSPRSQITSKLDASVGNYQMLIRHQDTVVKRLNRLEDKLVQNTITMNKCHQIIDQQNNIEKYMEILETEKVTAAEKYEEERKKYEKERIKRDKEIQGTPSPKPSERSPRSRSNSFIHKSD